MLIDPALFRPEAITEETKAFNAAIQQVFRSQPTTSSQTPERIREVRRSGESLFGPVVHSEHARTITIDGPGGDLELRVIDTGASTGVYLHIHGGGWVLGAADLSDVGNEAMALEAGVTVVSVEYRLAPEHRFPAGLDDCVAAANWLIEHSTEEFGTDALTIGGESSGANLAASTLLRVRDEIGYTGWRAANLVYGSYFVHGTPSSRLWEEEGLVLDPDTMTWFGEHYLGGNQVDIDNCALSPLYGDLSDMPPALFTVGTLDPLVDDSLFMATRWVTAGNDAELAVYPGGIHAFDAFPTTIGRDARARMHAFIRDAVIG